MDLKKKILLIVAVDLVASALILNGDKIVKAAENLRDTVLSRFGQKHGKHVT